MILKGVITGEPEGAGRVQKPEVTRKTAKIFSRLYERLLQLKR
jgi:hypothetical protein